jgi:hypothetical protein
MILVEFSTSISQIMERSGDSGTFFTLWDSFSRLNSQGYQENIGYRYPKGVITLVPNRYLNNDTYTVGWMGEEGLFAEKKHFEDPSNSFFIPYGSTALGIRSLVFFLFLI